LGKVSKKKKTGRGMDKVKMKDAEKIKEQELCLKQAEREINRLLFDPSATWRKHG